MNSNLKAGHPAHRIAFAAKSTQNARRNYWAARFDHNEFRIRVSAQALRIAEDGLIAATGSKEAARRAEVAYIESITEH